MHPTESLRSIDYLSGWNIVIAAAMAVTAYVSSVRSARKSKRDALREAADGWESLAEVKSKEIDELKGRLTRLEDANQQLNTSYRNALELNVQLQRDLREAQRGRNAIQDMKRELDEARAENANLRGRLEQAERQIGELQGLATKKESHRRESRTGSARPAAPIIPGRDQE